MNKSNKYAGPETDGDLDFQFIILRSIKAEMKSIIIVFT